MVNAGFTIQIPDMLRIQLNLFSGQLYLNSYADYQRVCAFLGVASVKTADSQDLAPDGFITDERKREVMRLQQESPQIHQVPDVSNQKGLSGYFKDTHWEDCRWRAFDSIRLPRGKASIYSSSLCDYVASSFFLNKSLNFETPDT